MCRNSATGLCKFATLDSFQNGHLEMLPLAATVKISQSYSFKSAFPGLELQFVGPWKKNTAKDCSSFLFLLKYICIYV